MMTIIARLCALAILFVGVPFLWYGPALDAQSAAAPLRLSSTGRDLRELRIAEVNAPKAQGRVAVGDVVDTGGNRRLTVRLLLGDLNGPTTYHVIHHREVRLVTLDPRPASGDQIVQQFKQPDEINTLIFGTFSLIMAALVLWRRPGAMAFFFAWFATGAPLDAFVPIRFLLGSPDPLYQAGEIGAFMLAGFGPTVALTAFALRFPEGHIAVRDRRWSHAIDGILIGTLLLYIVDIAHPLSFGWLFDNVIPLLAAALTLSIVVVKYSRSSGQQRQRVSWALLGIAASSAGYAAAGNPSAFLWHVPVAYAISTVLIGALPILLAYAILRHRVMDVGFALNRTIVYAAVTGIVVLGVSAVDWLTGRYLAGTKISLALDAAIAISFGVALNWFHRRIERGVDRLLFRERYRAWTRIDARIRALDFAESSDTVDAALVQDAATVLRLASAAVFRVNEDGGFVRLADIGWDGAAAVLPREHLLIRTLHSEEQTIVLAEHAIGGT